MNGREKSANVLRVMARVLSIFVMLLGIPFLLFVGLQLLSGEPGNAGIPLYLLLLIGLLAGLAIAWSKEGLGAAIATLSLLGSFALSRGTLGGVGASRGFTLFVGLVGPVSLLFALLIPGYSPERGTGARLTSAVAWALEIVPVVLFFASWLLRRKSADRR